MKALIETLMGVTVVTRSRIGFLIATLVTTTAAGAAAISGIDILTRNEGVVVIVVGLLGFFAWLAGRLRETRPAESTPVHDPEVEEPVAEHPLAFFGSLKYWGIILVLLAGTLSCLTIWRREKPVVLVRAHSLPATVTVTNVVTSVVTNVVTITNVARKVVFPSLRLHGVVVNGMKSSAVINGRVLWLGEAISNAVLVAVDSEHALVSMEGQTNTLALLK